LNTLAIFTGMMVKGEPHLVFTTRTSATVLKRERERVGVWERGGGKE